MLITEGRKEINEIANLADDIIKYFAKSNIYLVKDFIDGLSIKSLVFKTWKVRLKNIIGDFNKYPLLTNFITSFPIDIEINKNLKTGGVWQSYGDSGTIIVKIHESDFIGELKMFAHDYDLSYNALAYECLLELFAEIRSPLIHELQHAFDDYRSKNKYATDKRSKNYYKTVKYNVFGNDDRKSNEILTYYNLPHEYWARFSEFVSRRFSSYNKPFDDILKSFKLWFRGYDNLPENDRRRLVKALYKYWNEENDNIKENISEAIEPDKIQTHNNLVSLVKQYNQIPNAHNNKKYELYKNILNTVKSLNYQINSIKGELVVLNNDRPIRTIANRTSIDDINSKRTLPDYPEDFQEFVKKLIKFGDLKLHNIDTNADLVVAQKDILNGKKSVSANNVLESLEYMFNMGVINIKATKNTPALSIPINEYFSIFDSSDDSDEFWDAHFSKLQEKISNIKNNMQLNEEKINNITNLILERINYTKALEDMAYRKRDPEFFANKYNEWNSQGDNGYETPTEHSVFEFLQNNYEDLSNEDEVITAILSKLNSINESENKNKSKLNKFLTKIKELVIDVDSYRLVNHYKFKDIDGWPDITYTEYGDHPDKAKNEDELVTEQLDLENFEFIKLNDKELVFYAGGDWQYPYTVTVKLVGGKLKVVESRPYNKKTDNNGISNKDIIKLLGVEDLQKELEEKEIKRKADSYIENTKDKDFWDGMDIEKILNGISEIYSKPKPWGEISKHIKEYVKNKKNNMKTENKNLEKTKIIIEETIKGVLEGKSFDYMKAVKKADRELEYELNGPGWKAKDKAHKNHKNYDRKRDKKVNIDEASTNVKKINLVLTDVGVAKFKKVPTFNNLLAKQQVDGLVVGDNILTVNHYIYNAINRVSGYDPENIIVKDVFSESTYSFDSEDPNLQQKTDKLKNDTTLFNKDKDEIKINTESKKIVLTKEQIMEMNQLRQLNKKNIFTKNQIIEMLKKKMI